MLCYGFYGEEMCFINMDIMDIYCLNLIVKYVNFERIVYYIVFV